MQNPETAKQEREIAKQIGQFYLKKNLGNYAAAEREILSLGVTRIEIREGKLYLTAVGVGRLIGPYGLNIEKLGAHLGRPVHLIEEAVLGWLIPYEDEDEGWFDTAWKETDDGSVTGRGR